MNRMESVPTRRALTPHSHRGRRGLSDRLSTATLSIATGMRLSAVIVLLFSILTVVVWALPATSLTFAPLIALIGVVLAFTWGALTGLDLPPLTIIALALSAAVLPMMVALTGDLKYGVPVIGASVVAIVASVIFTAPTPTNHSFITGENCAETIAQRQRERALQEALIAGESVDEADVMVLRRVKTRPNERPTSLTLASAIGALILIAASAAWITLNSLEQWSVMIPVAAVLIALIVWGDQIGHTYRSQSMGALSVGAISGAIIGVVAYIAGRASQMTPIILPGLASVIGPIPAAALFGLLEGVAVGVTIVVLDGLLGDHTTRRPPTGALGRACAKFLVAAIPIYALIRIGGI